MFIFRIFKEDLEDFELEEFFEDTMNNEFNCILDDDSPKQLSKLILNYYKLYKSGQTVELIADLNKRFPKNKSSGINSSIKFKNDTQEDDEVKFLDFEEFSKISLNCCFLKTS